MQVGDLVRDRVDGDIGVLLSIRYGSGRAKVYWLKRGHFGSINDVYWLEVING